MMMQFTLIATLVVADLLVAGAACAALGPVTTVPLSDVAPGNYSIALAGAAGPQYSYDFGGTSGVGGGDSGGGGAGGGVGGSSGQIQMFVSLGDNAVSGANPSGSWDQQTFYPESGFVTYNASGGTPIYSGISSVDLQFSSGGKTYFGQALFDTNEDLYEISYAPELSSAVEPSGWALMIIGAGLTGAALRMRRRLAI
jgi:hypothetical protein